MRRGFRSFLSVVLTLSMLMSLTAPAWASPIDGTGAANSQFLVDKTSDITAYKIANKQYALSYNNATQVFSNSYFETSNDGTQGGNSKTYTGLTATSLVVGTGEYVVLKANLPTSIEGNGVLTYNVEEGSPVITGVDSSHGAGVPQGTLNVAQNKIASITGAFGTVSGKVRPVGDVLLGGNGYIVIGDDTNGAGIHDVTVNGNAQLYGLFEDVTINASAKVDITKDTYISGNLTIDEDSTLTVQQGVTLCVKGTSVKPTANTRIRTWDTLPAGTYASAEGNWTLGGDVTVNTTACGYSEHNVATEEGKHENTLNATLNGHTLTVKDGTVKVQGTGTVVGEGGSAVLRVASNTVNARGAFKSILMESFDDDGNSETPDVTAAFTVPAGQTISAEYTYEDGGSKTVTNSVTVKQDTVFEKFNGVLPVSGDENNPYEFLSLSGKWDNAEASVGTEVYVGSNAILTVKKNGMVISGTFNKLDTGDYSVTLGGDTVVADGTFNINGSSEGLYHLTINKGEGTITGAFRALTVNDGAFSIAGDAAQPYDLTIGGGTDTVTGAFRTLTVNGGTVTDALAGAPLTINNTETHETYTGIRVNDGSLTLSNTPEVKINGGAGYPAVYVTGGKLTMLNGTIEAWGNSVHAIEANSGGEVILGVEAGIDASDDISVPNVICHDTGSTALFVNNKGKAMVYSGNYRFNGENSDGIRVNNGGEAYLYSNDSDGKMNLTLNKPLIHVSGTHGAKAAVWVNEGGLLELRGRGALLEQPERNDSAGYALYIHSAAKEGCVLAGGTFHGDVFYQTNQTHTIPSIIPVNHYLRLDGTAPNYAASDGSRGILPKGTYTDADRYGSFVKRYEQANEFDTVYQDRFGKLGTYYSIVDAEWELRYQMTVNGGYQLPAGLLNGGGALTNTLKLDEKDPTKWGIDEKQGDLNVSANSTLYLAGKTLAYDGASDVTLYRTDVDTAPEPDTFKDKLQTVAITTGGSLTVIDAAFDGAGTDQTADKFTGGYIGTGTIAYTGTANDETAAVHVCTGGTLQVTSGKLSNTNAKGSASGVYLHGGTASFGTSEYSAASEDNDNAIIQVNGAKQALKVTSGVANVYGGTLKATVNSEVYGAVLTGGELNVRGGVLSGNHAEQGCGVYATGGTATITGGGLYGIYKADIAGSGTSLRVDGDGATVNLQINADHKDYTEAATDQTAGRHHICNINVKRGILNVGTRGATTYLRNNGALMLEGGTTYYFDGVTVGNTEVYGADTTSDFGTWFFVEDGDFGDLFVYNDDNSSMTYAVNLNDYVQLHGGYFKSITNNATTNAPASSVQSLIGVWAKKDHDGTNSEDWARYNHYAATVSAQRSERGEWSAVTAIQSGTAKTDSVPLIDYENGKAVSIRSAVDEFKTWAAGGPPNTFKLYANLWMGDSALCNALQYCDAAHEPVTVTAANRTLDLNGFGIFGQFNDRAILNVGSGGNLTMVDGDAGSAETYANRVRNFGSGAALNTAANGTLTVDGAVMNSNSGSAITTAGTTTVKSGAIMGNLGINATDGNLTVTGGTIGGANGIIFDGNGNLSISGGAIKSLDVKAGTGAISLTGDATYESVTTTRDSVYSSLLGNNYDWQKSVNNSAPEAMPRNTANYGSTSDSLVKSLPTAAGTVYSVKPVTHRLTINETSASMTTANATKPLTVECYVGDDILANAFVSAESSAAGVATVTGTYSAYTVTKIDEDANAATITFTSAYGDTATFRVNPAPVQTGGGGGGAAPAPATTVSVSGDESSVSISASVSGGTATMSEPTDKELEKVIGAGVDTGEVVINMSGLNSAVTTAAIPASTVKAVEKAVSDTTNDASALTIKLPNATATFDAAALSAITSQAKESSLALNVEEVAVGKLASAQQSALKELDVQEVISVTLKSGTTVISDFKGGSATVSVHYALKSGQSSRGVVVWYIANDGSCTEIPATYANGMVTFTTTHFSDYVIAYDAARAAACPQDSTCPITAFSDADAAAWYHDGVHWALENGVMSGYDNPGGAGKVFAANGDTTRAMVARILWNLEGKPAYVGASEYNDVDNEAWYGAAVRWASAEGIVNGYKSPTGTGMVFDPEGAVTREQLAAMLYRYAQYKKADVSVSASLSGYGDVQAVSGWAESAMQWAVGAGIINGIDGSLVPAGRATRAQVATMLMRYSTAK